jgi:hypothetical protein
MATNMLDADAQEGAQAFAQKRKPRLVLMPRPSSAGQAELRGWRSLHRGLVLRPVHLNDEAAFGQCYREACLDAGMALMDSIPRYYPDWAHLRPMISQGLCIK